jgi:hypothetical protein
VSLQGLKVVLEVLLAKRRQPPPTVAAGVPHGAFLAKLITLPTGSPETGRTQPGPLAMVCEAIVKLEVRLGAACVRACVRACV